MRKLLIITIIAFVIASCKQNYERPLTGNDVEDIQAFWLHRESRKDSFLVFNKEQQGWSAYVDAKNPEKNWLGVIHRNKFEYGIDTIQKKIILNYQDGGIKVLDYKLTFDEERILYVNGMEFIDGRYEVNRINGVNENDYIDPTYFNLQ